MRFHLQYSQYTTIYTHVSNFRNPTHVSNLIIQMVLAFLVTSLTTHGLIREVILMDNPIQTDRSRRSEYHIYVISDSTREQTMSILLYLLRVVGWNTSILSWKMPTVD